MNKNVNIKNIIIDKPLKLDCGQIINNYSLAYETYGSLNEKKDNAILIFHALTGDQFVSGINPITKKEGWWSYAVGPGKAIDTDKYFVICAMLLVAVWARMVPVKLTLIPIKNMVLLFLLLLLMTWLTRNLIS
jgi:homoserine O-acetyltransferase